MIHDDISILRFKSYTGKEEEKIPTGSILVFFPSIQKSKLFENIEAKQMQLSIYSSLGELFQISIRNFLKFLNIDITHMFIELDKTSEDENIYFRVSYYCTRYQKDFQEKVLLITKPVYIPETNNEDAWKDYNLILQKIENLRFKLPDSDDIEKITSFKEYIEDKKLDDLINSDNDKDFEIIDELFYSGSHLLSVSIEENRPLMIKNYSSEKQESEIHKQYGLIDAYLFDSDIEELESSDIPELNERYKSYFDNQFKNLPTEEELKIHFENENKLYEQFLKEQSEK